MAATRRDIATDADARAAYVEGVLLLKQEQLGPTTADLGIAGPATPVSTWDLFVAWHHIAMMTFTPPTQQDRNGAHRGPVFLPWHRFMLLLLELQLQRVLDDVDVGLPYWDWAVDGDRPPAEQASAAVWGEDAMGGSGSPVTTGPFAFRADDPTGFRVRIDADVQGNLRQVDRGLRRGFGENAGRLPTTARVEAALALRTYDAPPWTAASSGFRNTLEGWVPAATGPHLHNLVHVWIGGDMLISTSPNDPAFYLNHCNVDRIWAAWMERHPTSPYLPDADAPATLLGHRIDDAMHALLSAPFTPRQVLEVTDLYSYDVLPALVPA